MHPSRAMAGFAFLMLLAGSGAGAGEVIEEGSKVGFPDRITLESDEGPVELVATGTGLRTKFRFKVYACVSYADASADLGQDPASALIDLDAAKQIHMRFRRDVDAKKVTDAFRDGIEKNAKEALGPHQEDMERFLGFFDEDLVKDDTLTLTYLPGRGLVSSHNGEELGVVESPEFASFVWAIYFGEKPVSGKMKKQMVELVTKS